MLGEGNPCEYPVDYIGQDLHEAAKMVYYDKAQKKMVYRSPNDSWESFSTYFDVLWTTKNDDVSHWNFSLPTVYYQGLTEEVKMKLIEKKEDRGYGYKLPTAEKLRTKTEQIASGRELKCKAATAYNAIKKQEKAVMNWVYRASKNVHNGEACLLYTSPSPRDRG